MKELYRISDVAGLMGVNPKTLRYYEEQGILAPTAVDERTGYRYYDQQAVLYLWQMLVMREAGMTIQDLRDVAEDRDIEGQIEALRRRLSAVRTSISMLKRMERREEDDEYRIVKNRMPGGLYLRYRLVAETPDQVFEAFMHLFDMAMERGLAIDRKRPPFARFTDIVFQHENIKVEVYMPVRAGDGGEDVVWVEVPKAVSTVHHGDYSRVEEAYDALQEYVDENDLDVVDSPMEFYNFGLNDPQRSRMTTTVFFPIA